MSSRQLVANFDSLNFGARQVAYSVFCCWNNADEQVPENVSGQKTKTMSWKTW